MSGRERDGKALYRRLSGGRGSPGRDAVARNQRGRLMGAMAEAVHRQGYRSTTVSEIVGLAGVSKSSFYDHFRDKEECFLATMEAAATILRQRLDAAAAADSTRGRLETTAEVFVDAALEAPQVAHLVVVDSLSLGATAVPHRNRVLAYLEESVLDEFAGPGRDAAGAVVLARALAGGMLHAAYACFRDRQPEALRDGRQEILDWTLSYRGAADWRANERPSSGPGRRRGVAERLDDRSPSDPDRRHRIARAAVEIAAERGYGGLTIPLISARAAISNQTFYEHFPGKREAFLAGFDELAAEVSRATHKAMKEAENWEGGVSAALRTMLEWIAEDELLASVALFELPVLGPEDLDRRGIVRGAVQLFVAERPQGERRAQRSGLVLDATVGGVATVVQQELTAGRRSTLPALAPALTRFVVLPFSSPPTAQPSEAARRASIAPT